MSFLTLTFISWLLKLVAEAADSSSPPTQISANPLFTSGVVKETALKVGGNVDFEQAMRILHLSGRQPEKVYVKAQFKVCNSKLMCSSAAYCVCDR